jgi:hypothetical protein
MKTLAITAVVVCLAFINSPTLASETYEITSLGILDSNAGFNLRITEPGETGSTFFVFEEAGKIRMYAVKVDGEVDWTVFPDAQYLCQATSMSINDTWRFLDEDGAETVATVVAQQSVTTSAGTFSCFKVDVELASDLGAERESLWFSSGFGLVRDLDFFVGSVAITWQTDLISHNLAGGSGFFPLAVGNIWDYEETLLPVESTTWGAIKSKFK